jgi:hypothetical protein
MRGLSCGSTSTQVIDQLQRSPVVPPICFFKRADDGVAAHRDKVVVARLPMGAGTLIGGSTKAKRHGPRLSRFGR